VDETATEALTLNSDHAKTPKGTRKLLSAAARSCSNLWTKIMSSVDQASLADLAAVDPSESNLISSLINNYKK
jgi:hypothetical protein